MSRVPLLGGAYAARSIIANAQRCVNLFPEVNPKDSPTQLTHYQRPGFRALVQGPTMPWRGLYRSSDGQGFGVIGQEVYYISPGWLLTKLGTLDTALSTPVSFTDNGVNVMLVDNSPFGYQIGLGSHAFAKIIDPTGSFTGALRVDNIDTFIIWPIPQSNEFGSTLSASVTSGVFKFDSTYIAGKTNYPDPLVSLIVNRHEILLVGALKTEIWYDAGNPTFPFAELPGAYHEHGIVAPYSLASQDIAVYWLGQDLQGQGVVFRARGYKCERVSNHALEFALRKAAQSSTIADAIGYTYQQDGHVFYVLILPTANQTWVFDEASNEWHQRAWTDPQTGGLNRDRSNCAAFLYGKNVVGDWENGTLYALDLDYYVDTVNGVDCAISYIRSFPHITQGIAQGQLVPADGRQYEFNSFQADMECGLSQLDMSNKPPAVFLRASFDRGRTFGSAVEQSAGTEGQYFVFPLWRRLGISRDAIFELSYSFNGAAALNGAWIDTRVLDK